MANQPSHDLTTIYTDGNTGWDELGDYSSGAAPSTETEAYLQGSSCVSQLIASNKTGAASGMYFDAGADITAFTDNTDVFFIWWQFLFPSALNDYNETVGQTAPSSNSPGTASGFFVGIGSADGDYKWFAAGGADYGRYPYGGWQNIAIDPTRAASFTDGTPASSNYRVFGLLPNVTSAPSRGQSLVGEAIRWGRGTLTYTGGSPAGTFSALSDYNDSGDARLGLFQKQGSSYLWKGRLQLGTSGTSLLFDDGATINIDDTRQAYADFNVIEINNTSSDITFNGVSISKLKYLDALDYDSARGMIDVIDDSATVNILGSTFNDMDRFNFGLNTTVTGSAFNRCNRVRQNAASISGSVFLRSTDSDTALISSVSTLSSVTDCSWTSSGAGHAVELGSIADSATVSWDGNELIGYGTGSTGSTTGATGTDSAAIGCNVASGKELVISVVNGSTTPTFQNDGAGTVTITAAVSVTVTGLADSSELRIYEEGTTTEIAGVESLSGGVGTGLNNGTAGTSGGKNTFTFSTSANNDIDIIPFHITLNSVPLYNYNVGTGGSVPVVQTGDNVFDDPV